MEVLIGFSNRVVSQIADNIVAPFGRHLGYFFFLERNLKSLEKRIQELGDLNGRLKRNVNEAKRKGEEIQEDVQHWLSRVDRTFEKANDLLRGESLAKARCGNGSFPNLVLRHRWSRKVIDIVGEMDCEIRDAERFRSVSYRPVIKSSVEVRGYEAFETRMATFRGVIEALRDPNVSMVGVYGMGGVGKTMFAKAVARQVVEEKLFDEAVMVHVSQTPNYIQIQQEIGEKMGLEFHEKSLSVRAERLRYRMRQEEKILVILDDVWEKVNLEDVGISFGTDQKGCKILLTSRSKVVLQNDMGVSKNFVLGVLADREAKDLFNKILGDSAKGLEFQSLATEIVRECAGLPIAITTIACALRNKSHLIWSDALRQLRTPTSNKMNGMSEKVYSSIELSYNFLASEEAKSLLLLCSLHKEDANINMDYLSRYGLGLNLFEGITNLEEVRNRVLALVEYLKASCLLLDGDYYGLVKLHDVVRDVVFLIASKERHMHNIKDVAELEECLYRNKIRDSIAVSLFDANLDWLPQSLECPKLKFFVMSGNNETFPIPDQFFKEIKELRVLDLASICLKPLPSSICSLKNLQMLCLFQCKLGDPTFIGELKSLKVLDLSRSDVEQLPKQIGELTRLRILDLRYCSKLEVIQPCVLSCLIHLEELNMDASFTKWDAGIGNEGSNASLAELRNLAELRTLCLCIPDVNILPTGLFSGKLNRFKLSIGDSWLQFDDHGTSRNLKLKLKRSNLINEYGLDILLKTAEKLFLEGLEGVSYANELDREGFPQLKHLQFQNNNDMLYIINLAGHIHPYGVFLSLESLKLRAMMKLEKICHGIVKAESFGRLRSIIITHCDRLVHLLSFSIIGNLLELREIKVTECMMMEEIVSYGTEDTRDINNVATVIELPQLHSLCLGSLPKLREFSSELRTSFARCEEFLLADSPVTLFNGKVVFPCLEVLMLSAMNLEKLWPDQLPEASHFRNLRRLIVRGCHSLKHLFPFYIARSLKHLKRLQVSECGAMEEVLLMRETNKEEKETKKLVLNLEFLILKDLPNLKRFCFGSCIEFPSLKELIIRSCPKIGIAETRVVETNSEDTFQTTINSLCGKEVEFPNLEVLKLRTLNIRKIWHDPLPARLNLHNLKRLTVKECSELKSLILVSMTRSLVHLKKLKVCDCTGLKEVLVAEELGEKQRSHEILFGKLESLTLINLPKLVSFCAGEHIECPTLLQLAIQRCPKLRTFIVNSTSLGIGKEHEKMDLVAEQPLFSEKVVFPSLEVLHLSSIHVEKLWADQPPKTFHMQSLRKLIVQGCNSLKYLLPVSLTKRLIQLEHMEVRQCRVMETLVLNTEDPEEVEMREKKMLHKLKFLVVEELPNLTRLCAGCYIEYPSLKKFKINNCPKLWSTNQEVLELNSTENCSTTTCLCDHEICNPSLYELHHGQGDAVVSESECARTRLQKRELEPNFMHPWEENTCSHSPFKNLEILEVSRCGGLKNLVLPSISFKFLTTLRVSKCNGMVNLLALPTAKCLVQLQRMSIAECQSMTEIIANVGGDTENYEIVFSELEILALHQLPSLTSFASGSYIMRFPKLRKVVVNQCIQMQTFAHGAITPKLNGIIRIEHEHVWEDEDDAEWFFQEEDSFSSVEQLCDNDINTTLQELWKRTWRFNAIIFQRDLLGLME